MSVDELADCLIEAAEYYRENATKPLHAGWWNITARMKIIDATEIDDSYITITECKLRPLRIVRDRE